MKKKNANDFISVDFERASSTVEYWVVQKCVGDLVQPSKPLGFGQTICYFQNDIGISFEVPVCVFFFSFSIQLFLMNENEEKKKKQRINTKTSDGWICIWCKQVDTRAHTISLRYVMLFALHRTVLVCLVRVFFRSSSFSSVSTRFDSIERWHLDIKMYRFEIDRANSGSSFILIVGHWAD